MAQKKVKVKTEIAKDRKYYTQGDFGPKPPKPSGLVGPFPTPSIPIPGGGKADATKFPRPKLTDEEKEFIKKMKGNKK